MTWWKVIVLGQQRNRVRARQIVETLRRESAQVHQVLDQERELSYAKSDRIEEIEDRVKTIDKAIAWMEEQISAFLAGKSE